jgi:cystathionine beta-synthase
MSSKDRTFAKSQHNHSARTSSPGSFWCEDLTEAIGNTPIVKLRHLPASWGVESEIMVKLEFLNPTGSVKDRMAVYLLRQAVARGELKPGGTIVEATSGNTGAAVAMFAAAHGYKAILTIPDKMSKEKVDTLRAYGAEVHICPTAVEPDSPESYYETAKRLQRETPNSYFVGQYFNKDNIEAHYHTTGPEIWCQTGGEFDILVAGVGTGGTMSGTAKYIKEQNPAIQTVACDPEGSVFYNYHKDKTTVEPHPYLVEGIGDDFLCPTLDFSVIDIMYQVTDKECFDMARELALTEGILGGGSSGAAVLTALRHARTLKDPKRIVAILPDNGTKYISKIYNDQWMKDKGLL